MHSLLKFSIISFKCILCEICEANTTSLSVLEVLEAGPLMSNLIAFLVSSVIIWNLVFERCLPLRSLKRNLRELLL